MVAVGNLWEAQQALAYILQAPMVASTTAPWYDVVTGATKVIYTGRVMDVSIDGNTKDVEIVNTYGVNQLLHRKRAEIVTAKFKIVYQKGDSAVYIDGPGATYTSTLATGAAAFKQFQAGEKLTIGTGAGANRAAGALALILDNGDVLTAATKQLVCVVMNNAWCVERTLGLNSEGYVEENFTYKCLQRDYFEEDNFTGTYS